MDKPDTTGGAWIALVLTMGLPAFSLAVLFGLLVVGAWDAMIDILSGSEVSR
jgi:hypothetical protein